MKTFLSKTLLAAAVALVPLMSVLTAYAQPRHHATHPSYNAHEQYWGGSQRFSPEQQAIIDEITRNDAASGY